ncbi:MAG: hypothetical protein BroJett040_08000 [Oligoflexia bacterium]|nr:MAG: hypothetical protein BroJett040_08000 [Oligoflexia bacterium]
MDNFSDLHSVCIRVFNTISNTTTVFVLPLFLARIVFSNILGEGAKAFHSLKGVVIYFCLVSGFPLIIEVLFSIPESYLPRPQTLSAFTQGNPGWEVSSLPFAVDRILEVILAGLYWVVYYLHIFFMLLMCSMAPIVFLVSTLLGVGIGLEIFIGLLIVGSSWPIIWYGFDQVHDSLSSVQMDPFGAKCLELLLTLFKGLSPIAFASLAVKSPAGRAITQTAQSTIQAGKWAATRTVPVARMPGQALERRRESKIAALDEHKSRLFSGNHTVTASDDEIKDRLIKAKRQNQPKKGELSNESTHPRNI